MVKRINYDFLNCAKQMPALAHKNKNGEFDVKKSEVCNWLVKQPDIAQKVFNMAMNNRVIKFDSETGKWQGVDYEPDN